MILVCSFAFSQKEREQVQVAKPERVISTDSIYTITDVPAEFPGGIDIARQLFAQRFDASTFESSGTLKSELSFVILEDGRVDDIKVLGDNKSFNKEVLSAFIHLKNKKWTPGKINGIPVKSRFRMPINMTFE